jgi:hypothetical protein
MNLYIITSVFSVVMPPPPTRGQALAGIQVHRILDSRFRGSDVNCCMHWQKIFEKMYKLSLRATRRSEAIQKSSENIGYKWIAAPLSAARDGGCGSRDT